MALLFPCLNLLLNGLVYRFLSFSLILSISLSFFPLQFILKKTSGPVHLVIPSPCWPFYFNNRIFLNSRCEFYVELNSLFLECGPKSFDRGLQSSDHHRHQHTEQTLPSLQKLHSCFPFAVSLIPAPSFREPLISASIFPVFNFLVALWCFRFPFISLAVCSRIVDVTWLCRSIESSGCDIHSNVFRGLVHESSVSSRVCHALSCTHALSPSSLHLCFFLSCNWWGDVGCLVYFYDWKRSQIV